MKVKFKCWDKLNNRWIDLYKIFISKDGDVIAVIDIHNEQYGLHQAELVQFTGLHDKNGKEIYCGDIQDYQGSNPGDILIYSEQPIIEENAKLKRLLAEACDKLDYDDSFGNQFHECSEELQQWYEAHKEQEMINENKT